MEKRTTMTTCRASEEAEDGEEREKKTPVCTRSFTHSQHSRTIHPRQFNDECVCLFA